MRATAIVQAVIDAWEEKDANALAPSLSDDVICKQMFPQSIGKAQVLGFMQAITSAFPGWSFNGHSLQEESLAEHSWSVLHVTRVTATHKGFTCFMSLPTLFFTLVMYAMHEVTHVTAPYQGEDRNNHQLRISNEAVERSMNRCKTTLYRTECRAIGSS